MVSHSGSTGSRVRSLEIENSTNENEETTPLFSRLQMIPDSAMHLRKGVDGLWDGNMKTPKSYAFNLLTLTKGEALTTTSLALFEGLDQLKFAQLGGIEPSGYTEKLLKSVKGVNWANGANELIHLSMEVFEMNQSTKPCDGFFGSIVPRFLSLGSSALVISADDENNKQLLAVELVLAMRDLLLSIYQCSKEPLSPYHQQTTYTLGLLYFARAVCLVGYTALNISSWSSGSDSPNPIENDTHNNSTPSQHPTENENADLLEWKALCGMSIQIVSIFLFAAEHVINGYEKSRSELDTDIESKNDDPENRTISVSDMSNLGLTNILNNLMGKNLISVRDLNHYLDIGNILSEGNIPEVSKLSVSEKVGTVSIDGLIRLFNSSAEIRDYYRNEHDNLNSSKAEAFKALGLNPDSFNGVGQA